MDEEKRIVKGAEVKADLIFDGDNVIEKITQLEEELSRLVMERKRLQEEEYSHKKEIDFLKSTFLTYMQEKKLKSFNTNSCQVRIKNTKKIKISDEEVIPSNFKEESIKMKISKKKIKEALEQGIEVPGASIEINQSLAFKRD